jgi:predicted PurR-regulated permease PerM
METSIFSQIGIAGAALGFAYLIFKTFIAQQGNLIDALTKQHQESFDKLLKELQEHDERMIDKLNEIANALRAEVTK